MGERRRERRQRRRVRRADSSGEIDPAHLARLAWKLADDLDAKFDAGGPDELARRADFWRGVGAGLALATGEFPPSAFEGLDRILHRTDDHPIGAALEWGGKA